ncbi:DUF4190 domain-containing protein [Streptomyces sp. SCSIO ZS0520]|uniref:DUF4190 domain-containing protein n=1 Tax=Streptomyces sp. SCSIO ZS0520 TaxID=2892996 RepID=UPI0021DAF437|nr:DUF4190 domain-containing protein [Streptomyces sp. SCSIO ZS0520]
MAVEPQQPEGQGAVPGKPEYLDAPAAGAQPPGPGADTGSGAHRVSGAGLTQPDFTVPAGEPRDAPPGSPGTGGGTPAGTGAPVDSGAPVAEGPRDAVPGPAAATPPPDTSLHSQPTLTSLSFPFGESPAEQSGAGPVVQGPGQAVPGQGPAAPGQGPGTGGGPAGGGASGQHFGTGGGFAGPGAGSSGFSVPGGASGAPSTGGFAAPDPFAAPNPFAAPEQAVPPVPQALGGPAGYGYPGAAPPPYGAPPAPYGMPPYTGAPYPPSPYGWNGAAPMPSNGMGVASLVTGIVSAAGFCMWPLALLLGMMAIVFGTVQRGKVSRGEATNGGQALAGIICGSVGAGLSAILAIVMIAS